MRVVSQLKSYASLSSSSIIWVLWPLDVASVRRWKPDDSLIAAGVCSVYTGADILVKRWKVWIEEVGKRGSLARV